ncbi:d89ecf3c-88e0-40ef-93fe-ec863e1b6826 [Sclerotinia trifoliorum]|uniref:Cellulase n=1 Tax=Sclerotinia trifoliorum TaxID=28548 RepID=A0A8H2ZRD9_9HELO|nr:d89ecf3c-88e0-40ef-93fe-ec863e1b6826 [Sclerotinia trifoliorum]
MQLPMKTLIALLPFFLHVNAQASGSGTTTRYWDCCKPSCAWSGKATLASGSGPVGTCDIHDSPLSDPTANAVSGCDGGSSYMCSDQSPWAVTDDLAYGYAAVNIAGGSESSWCCACYELTFTSTALAGKKMIVQATNTGGDLGSNQFDLAIPGGGVGIFNGCTKEFGAPSSGWGAQYGGVSSASACSSFPAALQAGCNFRFGWFEGADNPTVNFKQVECPAALTKSTGCKRADDSNMPAPDVAGSASASPVAKVATPSPVAATPVSSSSAVVASSSAPAVAKHTSVKSSSSVPTVAPAPATTHVSSSSSSKISSTVAPQSTVASAPYGGENDDTCDAE